MSDSPNDCRHCGTFAAFDCSRGGYAVICAGCKIRTPEFPTQREALAVWHAAPPLKPPVRIPWDQTGKQLSQTATALSAELVNRRSRSSDERRKLAERCAMILSVCAMRLWDHETMRERR